MNNINGLSLFLSIADCNLELSFEQGENNYYADKLQKEVRQHFAGFLFNHKPRQVDGKIILENTFIIDSLKANENQKLAFYQKLFTASGKYTLTANSMLSLYELEIVIRHLVEKLLIGRGLCLHASGVVYNNEAYLFLGPSGVGKSTIVRLLKNRNIQPIADDSLYLVKKSKAYFVYQTTMHDKEQKVPKNKTAYKLGRIFFLQQSPEFSLETLKNKTTILKALLSQVWMHEENVAQTVRQITDLLKGAAPFQTLAFAKNKSRLKKLFESALL